MMKGYAILAALGLLLAACAPSAKTEAIRHTVSEINVSTDLSAIKNRDAVRYWQGLNTDLKTALASAFVNDISPDGSKLNVTVDALSLANAYSANFGEDSVLSGRANLIDPRDNTKVASYDVTATVAQAEAYLPEPHTTKISPTSSEFYSALVTAFANGVYTTLQNAAAAKS